MEDWKVGGGGAWSHLRGGFGKRGSKGRKAISSLCVPQKGTKGRMLISSFGVPHNCMHRDT